MDFELNQAQKDSIVQTLNSLEEHYLRARKSIVDKLQEIENQLETHAENELVVSGLVFVRFQTQQRIDLIETAYKRFVSMTENYNKQLHGTIDGEFYGW
jgi:phospholipid N-methyltransferase